MKKDIIVVTIVGLVLGMLFIRYGLPTTGQQAKPAEQIEQKKGGEQKMKEENGTAPAMEIDVNAQYSALIKTSMGDITVELSAKDTPLTVNNFVVLAQKGFYDGTIFHRIIKGFMLQGGDPDGNGTGGPGYMFEDEFSPVEFDEPGILAMANRGPDTNGSQFFITHAPTPWLNGAHTIFGKVTKGMDVVNAIAEVQVGPQDMPVKDVVVETIEIMKGK